MSAREAPRPEVAVGAVVVDGTGRLLVVCRGQPPAEGRWTLPGGRLEPGERLEAAVRREVAEETGLEVEVDDLVGHLEVADDEHHFVILDFRAHLRDDFRAHLRDDFRAHLRDDFRAHLRDDFRARLAGGAPGAPRPGDDVTAAAWMTRSELAAAGPTDQLLDFLDRHGVDLAE